MKAFACPHCRRESITPLQKWSTGPLLPTTCKACGGKVGVPFTTLLWMTPFFASILLLEHSPLWISLPAMGAAFLVSSLLMLRFTPLVKR